MAKDTWCVPSWRHWQVKLITTTPRSEWLDGSKLLPCPSYDTSVHRSICNGLECNINQSLIPIFTNSKTTHHGSYPGSVLLDLVESINYVGFSQVNFYLLPTRLADEERLRSAVRDLVCNISAKTGDGRRVAWQFSHDRCPPKDFTFPFWYFISTNRERIARTAKLKKFNEDCDKFPT